MGLDVHFVRKPIHRNVITPFEDIVAGLHGSSNKDFTAVVEDLYNYTSSNNIDFEACLTDIIVSFLYRHNSNYYSEKEGEEVAYFRKLWWVVDHFNYRDDDYGQDIEITKAQVEELVTLSRKLILMVEKHFTDKGFEIEQSPINYKGPTLRFGGNREDYISFKNTILTDSMLDEADELCNNALDAEDSSTFFKICEMYIQFSNILETTDWDNQKIYMNADW